MSKINLIASIFIFSILLVITSAIKNKTRIIEKNISKIDRKIAAIEKDLHETQLDYFYVSSPGYLSKKIKQLDFIDYMPMDFSRIYFSYRDFLLHLWCFYSSWSRNTQHCRKKCRQKCLPTSTFNYIKSTRRKDNSKIIIIAGYQQELDQNSAS